jgi:1-acyl-sn-glycerol-3-phosphate acyltransferase
MHPETFDDLRPYYDAEIPPAMQRIADSELFATIAAYVYPDIDTENARRIIRGHSTIDDFQHQTMRAFTEQVIARSITRFTYEGLDNIDPAQRYLFISNHRDIVLDSTLTLYALHLSGHRTPEVTFGSNLMMSPLVVDVGKSNKMFKVVRGGNSKEFYANLLHLSQYIRHAITRKHESVWIAQRNGRTKDGNDTTDQALIKMLGMSQPDNPLQALAELHIVPVSISYQWESCDMLKAQELYHLRRSGSYTKQPGEDLHSILTGITQPKGEVHLCFGAPLSEGDLLPLATQPSSKFHQQVAQWLNSRIRQNYRLTCNSYIAHDLRSHSTCHATQYTEAEKEKFLQHYNTAITTATSVDNKSAFGDIFLGIYANSVDGKK